MPPVPQPWTETRRLWLCAHFPELALEVLRLDRSLDVAAVEDRKGRPCLHAVSQAAGQAGVEAGMSLAAARALCPGLLVRPRDPVAEQQALQRLAETGLDFTPWVSLDQPESLLLEVRASLKLFGGVESLREKLRQRLLVQGHRAVIAVTPSPEASGLLARLGVEATVEEREALRSALGGVPVVALSLDDKTLRRLFKTGIRRLADLWRLPRDGLARRYGAEFLCRLDGLAGAETRVLPVFHCPPRFSARLDMPMELERLEHFFPAIERLAGEFAAFLLARDAAAWGVTLEIFHQRFPASRIDLSFRSAHRDAAHWLKLLREKLERVALPAPVIAVQWMSETIVPFEAERMDLFGDGSEERDWQAVLEELQARLGHQALQRFAVLDDHRPERVNGRGVASFNKFGSTEKFVGSPPRSPRQGMPGSMAMDGAQRRLATSLSLDFGIPCRNDEVGYHPSHLPARPLWLLAEPQPVDTRDIRLLSEAERIESGWWDGSAVRRDYRVALDRQGRKLWVFRDLNDGGGWYLHGLFG
jgi:protein ImuB